MPGPPLRYCADFTIVWKALCQGKKKTAYSSFAFKYCQHQYFIFIFTVVCNKKPIVLSSEYMLRSLHYVHNSGQLGVLRYFGGWIYYLFSHAAILLQCFVNLCASFGFGCMHGVKML